MQLRRDFYKDITVCSNCDGSGILNPEDSSYDYKYCKSCEGYGAYIEEKRGRVVVGFPIFVDYPARRKLKIARLSTVVFLLLIIGISALIIF